MTAKLAELSDNCLHTIVLYDDCSGRIMNSDMETEVFDFDSKKQLDAYLAEPEAKTFRWCLPDGEMLTENLKPGEHADTDCGDFVVTVRRKEQP